MNKNNIFIERNSPSDEEFLIHKIFVSNGDHVKKDTLLAEVEGAKTIFEIYSESEGYFYTKFQPGDYVNIETAFAIISKAKESFNEAVSQTSEENNSEKKLNLSKPAKKYIDDQNIDLDPFINILKEIDLITVDDIKKTLNKNQDSNRFEVNITKNNIKNWQLKVKDTDNKEPIFIVGGGYGAFQVLDLILKTEKYYLEGYFDDSNKKTKLDLLNIKKFGDTSIKNIENALKPYEVKNLTIAISNNPKLRSKFKTLNKSGINLITLIHPSAVLGTNVEIGYGSTIFANVHIGCDTSIGEMSFISSNSTIEHHNKIGESFCCGPNFSTSGVVEVGDLVRTGINVGIEPFLKIGDNAVLASGVVVTKNINDSETLKLSK
jgi:acetyltransferase EpsM|tara:strand:- start:1188 stop:2318 length:1131 start_codon:yes stop_codon:yes gene_type:complete